MVVPTYVVGTVFDGAIFVRTRIEHTTSFGKPSYVFPRNLVKMYEGALPSLAKSKRREGTRIIVADSPEAARDKYIKWALAK